ncbi:uncharacterized protein DMENIID0001_015980 [Sergentomyia squamirostris]
MKYLSGGHRESYTLVARKRRQHMAGCATSSSVTPNAASAISPSHASTKSPGHNPERLYGATQDLFEILERVQNSRLDDQRCVLPPYFSQTTIIPHTLILWCVQFDDHMYHFHRIEGFDGVEFSA